MQNVSGRDIYARNPRNNPLDFNEPCPQLLDRNDSADVEVRLTNEGVKGIDGLGNAGFRYGLEMKAQVEADQSRKEFGGFLKLGGKVVGISKGHAWNAKMSGLTILAHVISSLAR